jgi:hypothetical protein
MWSTSLSKLVRMLCLICLSVLFLGCESTSRPDREETLISNGSFEKKGKPSLEGWEILNPTLAQSENEGGPGGGSWSIKLTADWAPTSAVVWQKIDGVKNGDVLTLSSYVKARPDGGGIMKLVCGPHAQLPSRERWVTSDSTGWVKVAVTDTLSLAEGEFVWVVLSSHHTELVPRMGLFDEVRLVRGRGGDAAMGVLEDAVPE